MTDKAKKIIKISGIVAVVLGSVGIYIGGGSEGYTIEIIASVFAGIGLITALIKSA
jgi:hypothetical protein